MGDGVPVVLEGHAHIRGKIPRSIGLTSAFLGQIWDLATYGLKRLPRRPLAHAHL